MSDKIIKALNSLDHDNDNHWTADGLPRLDTIRILTSDPTLSRHLVEDAYPDFKRNSVQAGKTANPSNPSTTEETSVQGAPQASTEENLPVLNQVLTQTQEDLDTLNKDLEDLRADMEDASIALNEAKVRYTDALNAFANKEAEIIEFQKDTGINPIQAYLAQQQETVIAREKAHRAVIESGVDIKRLLIEGKAPLDVAFANRRRKGYGLR